MIRSNKTAAFIAECLKEETTEDTIVEAMLEKYDAPRDVLGKDVSEVIEKFASLVVGQIALRALLRFLEEFSKATYENAFKKRLFRDLLMRDYGEVTAVHSGEWMNSLTSDTVVVAEGLSTIVPGVAGMITRMAGALVVILMMVPKFFYILVPGGILLVLLTYAFRKRSKKLHKRMQEKDGIVRIFLQEHLGSLMIVKAFDREEESVLQAESAMADHKKARMKKNHFSNLILDEATSALDADTKRKVLENIKSMIDKTVIIVTHRPAASAAITSVAQLQTANSFL